MGKADKTAEFLSAMSKAAPIEPEQRPAPAAVAPLPANEPGPAPAAPSVRASRKPRKPPRAELKHFGGYLDDDTLEKIALLRVRLKKDNSELIKLAVDELHAKHMAKRKFGDA